MKIHGNRPAGGKQPVSKANKAAGAGKSAEKSTSGAAGGADKVRLSGKACIIAELQESISRLPEIRTEKVKSIEESLTKGKYKVDSMKVAEKMIDEME